MKVVVDRVHFCMWGKTKVREGEWLTDSCADGLYGVVLKECVVRNSTGVWHEANHCGGEREGL